jgi:hypothetical protein
MATPDQPLFETPKFRQLLFIVGLLWLGFVGLVLVSMTMGEFPIDFTDPIVTPCFYLFLFGGASGWVIWQYRQRGIQLRSLLGPWPSPIRWRAIWGLWITLFLFSLGAFQVSFTLLSFLTPQLVESTLQETIFLGPEKTAWPWLYNVLMVGILVVAAPVLEEFLFRGFLLHRWGTRWRLGTAVILSSVLFGVLHSNIVGLTVFGLVMALLYLRSRSLGLVMIVHSLNNAIAACLEIATRLLGADLQPSLATFRANVWLGLLFLAVSTPWVVRFVRQNWPVTQAPLPYFDPGDRAISP